MSTATLNTAPEWPGAWVRDRLGITLTTSRSLAGLDLTDLVGLAVRRNPRRAHLLVSTVLGKHVPTDPRVVYGAGLLLGTLVRRQLAGARPFAVADPDGGLLLRVALTGDTAAADTLVATYAPSLVVAAPAGTVVLGYAETATALGHAVADALAAPALHSTRRPVPGVRPVGGFEEEHSHATSHLLLPQDPNLLAGAGPLVLVDDELSTGTTALNTIRTLHATAPRDQYVIASLIDLRSDADTARMAAVAAELGTRIDTVALAAGTVDLPPDVLTRAANLVAANEARHNPPVTAASGAVNRVAVNWPAGMRDGGRHGFTSADRHALEAACADAADALARHVGPGKRVHVLGFEELMYAPLRLAADLAARPDLTVTYSTTTRSPVLAVDDAGYAIRTRLVFPAHDNPADGPGDRYAYNIGPATTADGDRFDTVVLVVDDTADTPALTGPGGLASRLADLAARVLILTIPSYRPTTPNKDTL